MQKQFEGAYVVAVDMGYGHQRAVFPLLDIALTPEEWKLEKPIIISANAYPGIPLSDQSRWEHTRKMYELISRLNSVPLLGKYIFGIMDHFQKIRPFYPKRDLSRPTFQTKFLYRMINRGFGKHLIDILNKKPLPLLTSFFAVAFCAEEHGYKGPIYCICTDTDISRAWAPLFPSKSNIVYLAPNKRVKERLLLYGVSLENIVVTGFPLPKVCLGEKENLEIARASIGRRTQILDPEGKYHEKQKEVIKECIGDYYTGDLGAKNILNLTFSVGGAGAQAGIGANILASLASHIKEGKLSLHLVAGSSKIISNLYHMEVQNLGLTEYVGKGIQIVYQENKFEYFKIFNELLVKTDILWTKPSELSFYAGLGLPIIIAPPIGSQEECNQAWLHSLGAGFEQNDPRFTHEWLFDWIRSGWLSEASINGFLNAPKRATFRIEDLILYGHRAEIEDIHFL